MVQPSQQHVAPCVKGAEWGLGTILVYPQTMDDIKP